MSQCDSLLLLLSSLFCLFDCLRLRFQVVQDSFILTIYLKKTMNSHASCICLPTAEIRWVCHQAGLYVNFKHYTSHLTALTMTLMNHIRISSVTCSRSSKQIQREKKKKKESGVRKQPTLSSSFLESKCFSTTFSMFSTSFSKFSKSEKDPAASTVPAGPKHW